MFKQLMSSPNYLNMDEVKIKFKNEQIIIFENLLTEEGFSLLKKEANKLKDFFIRKDFLMKDSENTPRRLSTINTIDIKSMSTILPSFYYDQDLLDFLSEIANETVYSLSNKFESFVINSLHQKNDTHGGHIDDYPYAFNIILEAPSVGGELELVLDSTKVSDLKNEEILKRYLLKAGNCYLLKSDVNVHRVAELKSDDVRTVLNFSYSDFKNKDLPSYSSSSLYGIE